MDMPQELQLMLLEMHVAEHDRIRREAAADPEKHKRTRVFPRDGNTNYQFYESKRGPRMKPVRYCYSSGRNAAGYFLTWRERELPSGSWARDQWVARKKRKACAEMARKRFIALEERRDRR